MLQRQCLVVNESARARVTAQGALFPVGLEFVFEGLKSLHDSKDRLKSLLRAHESGRKSGFSRQTEEGAAMPPSLCILALKDGVLRERRIKNGLPLVGTGRGQRRVWAACIGAG